MSTATLDGGHLKSFIERVGAGSPTVDDLRALLHHDAAEGLLYWRLRSAEMFADNGHSPEHSCAIWNARYAGKRAGSARRDGYVCVAIGGVRFLAHRLVFAMASGAWPSLHIDHIDGNPNNNKISNLREATQAENMRNCRPQSRSKTGYRGVHWHQASRKWRASICVAGARIYLGVFSEIEHAKAAYSAAAQKYFGEFARAA